MSSAFFRIPGDDSSQTSSDSSDDDGPSNELTEDVIDGEIGMTATETLSSTASLSVADDGEELNTINTDQYRNMMLATLLEDFYKTRAAEFINSSNPGVNYHRQSPEVQALAKELYVEAGKALSLNGLVPSTATSDNLRHVRRQYLSGLDNLSLRQVRDNDLLPDHLRQQLGKPQAELTLAQINQPNMDYLPGIFQDPMRSLLMHTGRRSLSPPQSDLQLSFTRPRRSHYESSFQQLRLLGRGGFGKVYHAYNVFDKREYAVKKIPLSPKLSQRYRESGFQELEHVLREMQALAQLEHNNIVRYHATWIEEPLMDSTEMSAFQPGIPHPRRRLIDNVPASATGRSIPRSSLVSELHSDGIIFESVNVSQGPDPISLSEDRHFSQPIAHSSLYDTESIRESQVFTDGQAYPRASMNNSETRFIESSVYVLHVQMSMYPITLAEYLSPAPAPTSSSSTDTKLTKRHCFHIVPALRILLGILYGLQYIHAKGLIHRDIKPSNIFISTVSVPELNIGLLAEGYQDIGDCLACHTNHQKTHSDPMKDHHYINPRIGDFGLVAHLTQSSPLNSEFNTKLVGTEFYRPPPVPSTAPNDASSPCQTATQTLTHHPIDSKLDIFALGVILLELLWQCRTTTERMHVLQDIQAEKLPPGFLDRIEAEELASKGLKTGVAAKVEELVRGMITSHPVKRFGCDEVKIRVEQILSELCRVE